MTTFAEAMATNPPRLVILFQRGGDGAEHFQWGTEKVMPALSLIGAIIRVQAELPLLEPGDERHDCNPSALVLAWDATTRTVQWFVNKDIPIEPLVGMLEVIKASLVGSRLAQHAAAQQMRIVGPDGQPIRGIK